MAEPLEIRVGDTVDVVRRALQVDAVPTPFSSPHADPGETSLRDTARGIHEKATAEMIAAMLVPMT